MSVKGQPGAWFEDAVRRGDLAAALSQASELRRPLVPVHALGLVVLLGKAGDPRHARWAARWAARLTLAQPSVDLAALCALVGARTACPAAGPGGLRPSPALATARGVHRAEQLLVRRGAR